MDESPEKAGFTGAKPEGSMHTQPAIVPLSQYAGSGALLNQRQGSALFDTKDRSVMGGVDIQRLIDGGVKECPIVIERAKVEEPALVSRSPAFTEIRHTIELVAPTSASVLFTGESGTGKEVVATLVHLKSGRPHSPFVAINCAALPKDVIDNELFGHEREAFTGAVSRRPGCFERANGGSLFLDEISEMHPQVQAKLLRALESKTIRRLGGHEDIRVDVRIIAATNRGVPEALASGALRSDLYYRLSVVEIHLPPLRERICDIPLLTDHFMQMFCEKHRRPLKHFSPESLKLLDGYEWPGNVRELRNVIETVVLLCPQDTVEARFLPIKVSHTGPGVREVQTRDSISVPYGTSLAESEKRLILHTLALSENNKSLAARILGLSRKAMYEKLRRYAAEKNKTGA
jgi:DNA-binding NtrC family response regulator